MSQTSFSLYFHNQWTDFHKLSCAGMPQMRAIYTYVGGTVATTNYWDIRPSVAVKALLANISWTAGWICTIELALGSAHQLSLLILFIICQSSYPYTEPLKHYLASVLQPVSILFVILVYNERKRACNCEVTWHDIIGLEQSRAF